MDTELTLTWYKRWWRSLTLWVNTAFGVVFYFLPVVQENFFLLQESFTPDIYRWLSFILVITNYWLRFRTKQPLSFKKRKPTTELGSATEYDSDNEHSTHAP